jgi:hypothetical protein
LTSRARLKRVDTQGRLTGGAAPGFRRTQSRHFLPTVSAEFSAAFKKRRSDKNLVNSLIEAPGEAKANDKI